MFHVEIQMIIKSKVNRDDLYIDDNSLIYSCPTRS